MAFYFFLDKKVTKNQVQPEGFFAALAFALQIGQKHGLQYFALLSLALALRFCKICYALPARKACIFCPISPKAVRLTVWVLAEISLVMKNQKSVKASQENRGQRAKATSGEGFFLLDLLPTFGSSQK